MPQFPTFTDTITKQINEQLAPHRNSSETVAQQAIFYFYAILFPARASRH